ncbi:hypothetical protein BCR34DRAFT_42653 [Clohesyomyces aquaticus]|uniref:Beta/gamma crystallin 'Greek key' domain-containing protein n=1 Tax=Clohesyomyces aquaticus TaxID=1231657 RepID=A0A1Y1Z683_9PLEO|nr:hypothetical protein BCR34DRAFT_42653 [Clohesyomyces aquaticus]
MLPTALLTCLAFVWFGVVGANNANDVIRVFLFAAPAFFQASEVDAPNGVCVSLMNNLIDGRTSSILIGGPDIPTVWKRKDDWKCTFFDNYECESGADRNLTFTDGVNSLGGIGWQTKIHGVKCELD